jgi:lysophospholipase L1-like esterase
MMARVTATYREVPFAYISIKPSIARWNLNESIKYANKLIANELVKYPNACFIDVYSKMLNSNGQPKPELYMPDGLHMSLKGYDVWKPAVLKYLLGLSVF